MELKLYMQAVLRLRSSLSLVTPLRTKILLAERSEDMLFVRTQSKRTDDIKLKLSTLSVLRLRSSKPVLSLSKGALVTPLRTEN